MIYFVVQKLLSLTYFLLFTPAFFSFPWGDRSKNIARLMSKRLVWDLDSWLHQGYLCGCDVSWGCGLPHRSKTKVWFSQTRTLHLLPFSSWPYPYTISCRKSVVLVFRSVLRDSCSLRGCSFGVSLGGGEPGSSYSTNLTRNLCKALP